MSLILLVAYIFFFLIYSSPPGEGPEGPKKFFLRPLFPLISGSGWPPPPSPLSEGLDPSLIMEYQLSIRRVFRVLIHHFMDVLLLICLFVCFCFVTGHAPCLPCPRGRSCTIDTPWQTHSSFKEKVKADIISPFFTISPESHPSVNQQFSSLCYSELIDNINFYLSQL